MQTREQPSDTPDHFTDTADAFHRWRATRPRGARIPAALWRSATALAAAHGVSRTSTALGLDYYALKKRLLAGPDDGTPATNAITDAPSPEQSTHFVELSLPVGIAPITCAIEVERASDAAGSSRLRLELQNVAVADVAVADVAVLLQSVWIGQA